MEEIQDKLIVIWYFNETNEKSEFQDINDGQFVDMKFFSNVDECIDFVTSHSNKHKKFLVVMSDYSVSEVVVTVLNEFPQLMSVFLLWNEREEENYNSMQHRWIKECTKNQLSIKDQSNATADAAATSTSVLTIFNRHEQSFTSDLRSENGNFLWFQLFIEILLRMTFNRQETKTQLIEYFKNAYQTDPPEILKIEKLEKEYSPEDAIRWYTKDMCLYRQLNESLRLKKVELLIEFSWFISDLYKQLNQESVSQKANATDEPIATVYRGQLISRKEFERIQNSVGSFLSVNSFFSTTEDRNVASFFAGNVYSAEVDLISLLFEIKTDRRVKNLKPYANISHYTLFPAEKEILFMLGTVFRIVSLKFNNEDNNLVLSLEICSEDDRDYQQMFEHEKHELVGENPTYYNLAELMYRVGDYDRSEKYFNEYLKMPINVIDTIQGYTGLSKVYGQKHNEELRKQFINKSNEIIKNQYAAIKDSNDLNELDKLLNDTLLNEEESSDIHMMKALVNVQNKRNDFAILNYQKVLSIQKRQLPEDHPDIARTLFVLGHSYVSLKQFEQAEKFMQEALQIRRKSLSGNHRDLAMTYSSLGSLYKIIMKNELALEYFLKAREIHLASGIPEALDLWIIETSIKQLQDIGCTVPSSTLN
ncbi:unnamed protein product [Rotaria sp. Silwood1]|nr:unnamed protein product [Rotaria sp. Silwood1]